VRLQLGDAAPHLDAGEFDCPHDEVPADGVYYDLVCEYGDSFFDHVYHAFERVGPALTRLLNRASSVPKADNNAPDQLVLDEDIPVVTGFPNMCDMYQLRPLSHPDDNH